MTVCPEPIASSFTERPWNFTVSEPLMSCGLPMLNPLALEIASATWLTDEELAARNREIRAILLRDLDRVTDPYGRPTDFVEIARRLTSKIVLDALVGHG